MPHRMMSVDTMVGCSPTNPSRAETCGHSDGTVALLHSDGYDDHHHDTLLSPALTAEAAALVVATRVSNAAAAAATLHSFFAAIV
jgi:hypothetical protein